MGGFYYTERILKKWENIYNTCMKENPKTLERIYKMTFATVYPLYIAKAEKK